MKKQELQHIEDVATLVGNRPFAFICVGGDVGIVREGESAPYYLPPRIIADLLNHKCGITEAEQLRLIDIQLRRQAIGGDESIGYEEGETE